MSCAVNGKLVIAVCEYSTLGCTTRLNQTHDVVFYTGVVCVHPQTFFVRFKNSIPFISHQPTNAYSGIGNVEQDLPAMV